jgi:replicative superfamily II helicase
MQYELKLVEEGLESSGPYKDKFSHFNLVQSTLLVNKIPDLNCNLVLGTATSTGKTISAEFFIYTTLAKRKMVIYAAPMRALANEKFEEWSETFKDLNVQIITGDFKINNKEDLLRDADILILTNEMLDVKTRGLRDEDHWLRRVGLLIVDESHIMGIEDRGSAAEAGIIRLTNFVPSARVVLLSATLPNYQHFVDWLGALNNKDTYYLNSNWRPIPLEWKYYGLNGVRTYQDRITRTLNECISIVKKCLPEKCLCFVHEKKTGASLLSELKNIGIIAEFHSADKSAVDRKRIEKSFSDRSENSLRVLISTNTTAWGLSLPAKNVVICGTKRGLSQMNPADIIQMAGRSGRSGWDTSGTCHLISDEIDDWKDKIINQSPVLSQMGEPNALGFQLLAEIYLRVIKTIEDLSKWYDRTLISVQCKDSKQLFLTAVTRLKQYNMIVANEDGELFATPLGKLSTRSYFRPDDTHHWSNYLIELEKSKKDLDDYRAAVLIGMTPSIAIAYTPKQYQGNIDGFTTRCRQNNINISQGSCSLFIAYCVYEQLKGEAASKGLSFYVQNLVTDADRICNTLGEICKLHQLDLTITNLLPRLKYGVPAEMANLCQIPGIGAKRAFLLWGNSIKSREDLLKAGREKISKILGPTVTKKIFEGLTV